MNWRLSQLILTIAAGALPAFSQSIIFSNVTGYYSSTTGSDQTPAAQFTASVNAQLTGVGVELNNFNPSNPAEVITFTLYSNNGGSPGAAFATLTGTVPADNGTQPPITLSGPPSSPVTLMSGTAYWLGMSLPAGVGWELNGSSLQPYALSGIPLGSQAVQFEILGTVAPGLTWTLNNAVLQPGFGSPTVTGSFAFNADANTYSNWSLTVSGASPPFTSETFTPNDSSIQAGADAYGFGVMDPTTNQTLFFAFCGGLSGTPMPLTDAGGTLNLCGVAGGGLEYDSDPPVIDGPFVSGTVSATPVTISGQVTFLGSGLGVAITLSGSESGSTLTNSSGNYSFAVMPGGNYTVTPSLSGFTFSPSSYSFTNLSGNQTANFTASRVSATYTISGQTTLYGNALNGATITLNGSQSGSVTTSGSGNYSFTVAPGGNYTVTASGTGTDYYFFPYPPSVTFNSLGANQTANFLASVPSDFNHDGHPDVIWEEPKIGWAQVWYLGGPQGVSITNAANLTQANPWQIVGVADFNGDGYADVVWQDPVSGAVQVWYLGDALGNQLIGALDITTSNPWRIVSVADFNGDGHPDLLWQDPVSGFSQIWYMGGPQGTTLLGAADLDQTNPWRIVGTGDFNGDGVPDVLWQDPVSGTVQIWYMGGTTPGSQGTQLMSAVNLTGAMTTKVVAIADFNLDGHPDVVFQDPATGAATVYYYTGAQGTTPDGTAVLSMGNPWYIAGPH